MGKVSREGTGEGRGLTPRFSGTSLSFENCDVCVCASDVGFSRPSVGSSQTSVAEHVIWRHYQLHLISWSHHWRIQTSMEMAADCHQSPGFWLSHSRTMTMIIKLPQKHIDRREKVTVILIFELQAIFPRQKIKRQFIRRSNVARVTTRAPYNVCCSYSGNS